MEERMERMKEMAIDMKRLNITMALALVSLRDGS